MNHNSRTLFDEFYKNLLNGGNSDHPIPTSFLLAKQNLLFPDKGLVFDYIFDKSKLQWVSWLSTEKMELPQDCRVCNFY